MLQSATVDFTTASIVQPKPLGLQTLRGSTNFIFFIEGPLDWNVWKPLHHDHTEIHFSSLIWWIDLLMLSTKLSFNCNLHVLFLPMYIDLSRKRLNYQYFSLLNPILMLTDALPFYCSIFHVTGQLLLELQKLHTRETPIEGNQEQQSSF